MSQSVEDMLVYGRPQAIINRDLERYELLGFDGRSGEHRLTRLVDTRRFEEEFETSVQR